jgi:cytochrome c-type biogenesis protein CcmH/NrfG
LYLAEIAREMGDLEGAISAYRKVLQLDSHQPKLIFLLGEAYQTAGVVEDVFRQFYRLRDIDPKNP